MGLLEQPYPQWDWAEPQNSSLLPKSEFILADVLTGGSMSLVVRVTVDPGLYVPVLV
jgi:hypothetical protein